MKQSFRQSRIADKDRMERLKKYGLGGTIGTVVGAGAGALVGNPMIGASIGGAIGGAVDNKVEADKASKLARQNAFLNRQIGGINTGQFAYGGAVDKMSNKSYQFTGPRHEAGGVQMGPLGEAEGGETIKKDFIFSDRLTIPGTNQTFASKHKKLEKAGGANKLELDTLARMQEKQKTYESAVAPGKQYWDGGPVLDPLKRASLADMEEGLPESWRSIPPEVDKAKLAGQTVTPSSESNVSSMSADKIRQGIKNSLNPEYVPVTVDDPKMTAAQIAPDVVNMALAFTPDMTPDPVVEKRTTVPKRNKGFNVNPILNSNAASYRSILSTPGVSTNAALMAQGQKQQADSAAFAQKNNVEMQDDLNRETLQAQLDSGTNSRNASFRESYRQDKQAALGARTNLATTALSNISNKYAMLDRDKRLKQMEEARMRLYERIYGVV